MSASKYASVGRAKGQSPERSLSGFSKKALAIVGIAVVGLGAIYWSSAQSAAGKFTFQVGDPAPGEIAPPIRLTSGSDTFDLAAQRGETVLLYFQEGLMCQPCWDQITEIEENMDAFRELGIDKIVSITTDPADLLQRKTAAEGIEMPVLSDPDLLVSRAYNTYLYGMMGDTHNGHSFIVVGPEGRIQWRADYGGAPDYTMFLPAANLLADLRRGLGEG